MLPIAIWPDQILKTVAKPVEHFDETELLHIIGDMVHTMRASKGAGLAATQVYINKRILVLDIDNKAYYYINPQIVPAEDKKMVWNEGCLSVPGYFEDRERSSFVTVSFQDVTGKVHCSQVEELHAFALQHEIDHLNGKTFVDNLSALKKDRVKSKIYITLKRRSRKSKRRR